MDKNNIFDFMDEKYDYFASLSDQVWDFAETAFEEFHSAAVLQDALSELGFDVETDVAHVPNAFIGSWGSGKPVIAFLGEFDALSGMSQKAGAESEIPLVKGGNGHGCGHNLLGAGALAAAAAVREYLKETGKPGTVKYFGCPGEEGGSGKAFMARAGVFDDLDLALTWHPANFNSVFDISSLANYQVRYKFTGRSSHAAAAPQYGRSALDAVELMNVGVQFLREHIIQEARIHYAITNTGGFSPNVVQANAEVLYLIRAPKLEQVEEIYQRVNKIAEGMAMATETEVEIQFVKSCADVVPNKVLSSLLEKSLNEAPKPHYSPADHEFAAKLDQTFPKALPMQAMVNITEDDLANVMEKMKGKSIFEDVLPFYFNRTPTVLPGSTDVGDVSHIVPTGQVITSCWTFKTPPHTWQTVAIGKHPIAHKGMMLAAKALASAAMALYEDPTVIESAKTEFLKRMGGAKYVSPIPKEVMPSTIS